jgi:predicted branched-subunit amino acid permease
VLSTVLVWAGPAQAIFYGGLAAGMAPAAIAVAVCFSSIRFFPMTLAFLPLLRGGDGGGGEVRRTPLWVQLLAAHYVAVTVWTECIRRLPEVPEARRLPFFFGFANACLILAATGTGVGYFLLGALPLPLAAGMLFLTPVFFTVSVSAGAKRLEEWASIGLGFSLEPVMRLAVGDSFDLLAVGLVGGTLAFVIGQRRQGALR